MNEEKQKAIVSAVVVLVVNLGSMLGFSVDAGMLSDVLFAAALLATTGYAIWKNHNFTDAAVAGQKVTDELKDGSR